MEHNPLSSMKERLLHKIDAQELNMRPKVYFTLHVAALVLVAIAVLLVSIFIFNFILFSIRINSHDSLLMFGPRGIWAFILFFPWTFLIIDILLIALLEWLLRKFRLGNKIPVLYLLLGLVGLTAVTGLFLDRATTFNDRLLIRADQHHLLPPLNTFYVSARHHLTPESGVCTCVVTAIEGNKMYLRDTEGTTSIIATLPPNDPRATTTLFKVGDLVFIAGDPEGGGIRAFGIRPLMK